MKPTYDDLLRIIEKQAKIIEDQRKTIERLEKRVAELEERLGLNSDNSSKPPSSDQKKNKKAPKGGATPGHKGSFRKAYSDDQITQRIVSRLASCPHCGSASLKRKDNEVFQQVDLPPIKPEVTQIEREKACCMGCRRNIVAPFPKDYDSNTAFGPRLTAFVGMCSSIYRLSKRSIQNLLNTAFGIDLALGSVPAMERRISKGLKDPYESLFERVNTACVGYIDETSFRVQAKTHYVWTVATEKASFFRILPTRGLDSLNEIRPRSHSGITVSDRYQVYAYEKHQYCLAHLKRDFEKFAQRKGVDGEFGNRMLFELKEIFAACKLVCKKSAQRQIGYRKKKLNDILLEAFSEATDSLSRFSERLLDRYDKLFYFMKHEAVDCTNNAAERALRHIVLWRKTSYGTQSDMGSRFLERSISVWMTLKQQEKEVFSFFCQAYRSTFDPSVPTPAI